MADRIEYQGDLLPSGLPGFGNASVQTLSLPGFNTVVAPQKFGPAVDAPDVTPPDPTPPPGNTPSNPTDDVVTPSQPGGGPSDPTFFCKQCVDQGEQGFDPLMIGKRLTDTCVDCSGKRKTVTRYFADHASKNGGQTGLFWDLQDYLVGKDSSSGRWELSHRKLTAEDEGKEWGLKKEGVTLVKDNESNLYEPKEIKVCVDEQIRTWYVLAYQKA